ncbi:MAG: VCBS repeat-containing protein [Acidobacteria bacterium]|nr:VCBS repeat-containing protein [Acidobacteriota bacterium]
MNKAARSCWLMAVLGVGLFTGHAGRSDHPQAVKPDDRREAAYRANNRGVALLEQFAYQAAVGAFRQAIELDPSLRLPRLNLPIALFYAGSVKEATTQAAAARDKYPDAPQPSYLLGLVARSENRPDEAATAFRHVLEMDSQDVGAKVNLAQVYIQQRKYAEAATLCESALAIEPYNATAAYNRAIALVRAGSRDRGQAAMQRFQELRASAYSVTYSQNYLEQGRYAEAVSSTGAEPELVSTEPPPVVFADATASLLDGEGGRSEAAQLGQVASPTGGVTLADIDGDGDLDVISTGATVRVLKNDRPRLVDVTRQVGLAMVGGPTTGAVAGDFNNDSRIDLLLLGSTGQRLFVQGGNGVFRVVDPSVGLTGLPAVARSAAFVDIDHDGDLDIFVGGPTSRLMRNNGNGTFTDITTASGLDGVAAVVAVAPTDFDNRRDIDLLIASHGTRPRLFRNLRNGSFVDVAASVGLPDGGPYTTMAVGDVNKDGFTDAFFGREAATGLWAISDGRGRFRLENAPPSSQDTTAAQIFDYDNDGLLDVFSITRDGPRVLRNAGRLWQEQTGRALSKEVQDGARAAGGVTAIASGDLDLDGDTDVVARLQTGALRIWRNDGGNRNRSLRVRLTGRVSNRGGVGAKVEVRAGSLYEKLETAATAPPTAPADVVFGLGRRSAADVVRILWPAGILQTETNLGEAVPSAGLSILELDRKPSSCPYLYAWNGQRFAFVTDFLGGGEMGSWVAPNVRNVPDPDEYVRMTDQQLKPRDGRVEIRVTNELEEALFLDEVKLLAVTHPAEVEVYPDEGMRARPRPFRLFATRDAHAPIAAIDDHGHDVLAKISHLDRSYPDDFELLPIRGYAREHAVTVELPAGALPANAAGARTVLLLTGWTDYAFSSDNVAAHQAGLSLSPPALQAEGPDGRWRTVDPDVGVPVGRPQTLVVDITTFLRESRRFRIVTTMRVYWDRILVATAIPDVPTPRALARRSANLAWRGFSAEITADGREPLAYDYDRILFVSPWKLMPGRYTREGDVSELVARADDRFVVSRPGDALALSFDASALPPLPPRTRRTFLLHSVGYSKEMDLHSASPDEALPIPFRAMRRYPYTSPERYPHDQDFDRFHTRVVSRSIPALHAAGPLLDR